MSVRHGTGCFIGKENGTVAEPGEGPPLFLDQNEARRAEKKIFEAGHLPPLSQGLDDRPPPPLSEGLSPPLRY